MEMSVIRPASQKEEWNGCVGTQSVAIVVHEHTVGDCNSA